MSTRLILEEFEHKQVNPEAMEILLADGWRHFGERFFRYNVSIHQEQLCDVIPLRINLKDFSFSKSQRKILKKNRHFRHIVQDLTVDHQKIELFEQHKHKFNENVPPSIYEFISRQSPAYIPCLTREISVYDGEKLIACSFMDDIPNSCSSIYGMFDLGYGSYSLGIYTMLLEIAYAIETGKDYYYHGYCLNVPSFYDYKLRFNNLEKYDWKGGWHKHAAQ